MQFKRCSKFEIRTLIGQSLKYTPDRVGGGGRNEKRSADRPETETVTKKVIIDSSDTPTRGR